MITYKRGDIILVPFPFSNQTTMKKRPAVIISSDVYNMSASDIVIMAITSQIYKTDTIGVCVIKNWQQAGLFMQSAIKPAISTIEQIIVIKRLGKLAHEDILSMDLALMKLLGIQVL
ncbi:MAG: type II toxin-antitoxin system PemK/MazF family toxin [Candidatus Magnetoovum sp. WYHC-5]|nr:type II toxin-antitoxin system PemK/MazF family toxin [Candidatus Magnetoovum sp. WYHC-5]